MKLYEYHLEGNVALTTEVPLIKCTNEYIPSNIVESDYFGQYYCPDFDENAQLWTNFYYDENTWIRWTMEKCDNATSKVTCVSDQDIAEYAYENIMVVQGRVANTNLGSKL